MGESLKNGHLGQDKLGWSCLLPFSTLQLQNVWFSCPLWREPPTSPRSRTFIILARRWPSPVEIASGFPLLGTPLQRLHATMTDNGPSGQCAKVQSHNTNTVLFLWFLNPWWQISVQNSNLCCSRGCMHQSTRLPHQEVGCVVEPATQTGRYSTIWLCLRLQKPWWLLLG